MIFQEPLSALSPLQTIGRQMEEVVRIHTDVSSRKAKAHFPGRGWKRSGSRMLPNDCRRIPISFQAVCSSGS
jgi:ABC-type dipeptide/oligopeptide/nickel transport system ATPase component